jgi:hypothetical protein
VGAEVGAGRGRVAACKMGPLSNIMNQFPGEKWGRGGHRRAIVHALGLRNVAVAFEVSQRSSPFLRYVWS